MASVTQEPIGVQHERITIQLTREDYWPAVDKALRQVSKKAQLPGFRPGMVPVGMIRKMYGQSVFSDEVLRVAGSKLEEHLINNKAEIFAQPLPAESQSKLELDINNPQSYTFEFEIGTRPDFDIPLLKSGTRIPFHKVIVSDEMLAEEIEKLQYKAGNMTEPETITSADNVVNVEFVEVDADGQNIPKGIRKDNSLLLKYFSAPLQEQLMGKKTGDSILFSLRDSFEAKLLPAILRDLGLDPNDELAQDKRFRLEITKLGLIEKAALDQEMFEKIYPGRDIADAEAFAEVLKGEIQQYWDSQARTRLHNELFEHLVHETPISIPVAFLKRWMSVGGEKYKSPEEVEKEYGSFDHQLRWQLISNKLMQEHQIQVEEEEIEDATRMQIVNYFSQSGHTPDLQDEWFERLVRKQLDDSKFREETQHRILMDKLFYVLEQRIPLEEKWVSLDEFQRLPSAHHHHH